MGHFLDDAAIKPDAGETFTSELPLVSGAVGRQWVFAGVGEAISVVLKAQAAGFVPRPTAHTYKVRAPLDSVCALRILC